MHNNELQFISKLFPFENIDHNTLEAVLSSISYSKIDFLKGDIIYSPENFQSKIGFIVDGECEVMRIRADGDSVFLNKISKYGSFGILSFLSPEKEYPTQIKALKTSTVLFISGEDMISVMKEYPEISMNVIKFLAERLIFLNKKMATFSEKSTAGKLASYLLTKLRESGNEFTASRTSISAEIDVGRASLYRDLEYFENENLIKTVGKKIIILSREGLENIKNNIHGR